MYAVQLFVASLFDHGTNLISSVDVNNISVVSLIYIFPRVSYLKMSTVLIYKNF